MHKNFYCFEIYVGKTGGISFLINDVQYNFHIKIITPSTEEQQIYENYYFQLLPPLSVTMNNKTLNVCESLVVCREHVNCFQDLVKLMRTNPDAKIKLFNTIIDVNTQNKNDIINVFIKLGGNIKCSIVKHFNLLLLKDFTVKINETTYYDVMFMKTEKQKTNNLLICKNDNGVVTCMNKPCHNKIRRRLFNTMMNIYNLENKEGVVKKYKICSELEFDILSHFLTDLCEERQMLWSFHDGYVEYTNKRKLNAVLPSKYKNVHIIVYSGFVNLNGHYCEEYNALLKKNKHCIYL